MNRKKRQIIEISVFVASVLIVFLGVTFAFMTLTVTGSKRQVITAGNLDLELLEDENSLTIVDALPVYDEVGMIQDAFTFRLINKTNADTNYIVKLVDITTGEKLDSSIVQYGLEKDNEIRINPISSLFQERLDTGIIKGGQTIHYALRLWINEDVTDNSLITGKSLSFRVDVEVSQKVVLNPSGTLCPNDNEACNSLHQLPISDVTKFENRIDIPDTVSTDKQWDVSEARDGSVMAYLEETENENVLHIQGNGGIYLPENSNGLLEFPRLEGLEFLDASKVVTMQSIFAGTETKNIDFSVLQWDTSNVTDMTFMFSCSKIENLNLSGLNTSNVTDITHMFGGSDDCYIQNLDLTGFDTSSVTSMNSLFSGLTLGNTYLRIYDWDVSNVTDMGLMFSSANIKNLDIRNMNVSKNVDTSGMFSSASIKTLNISDSDFSNITELTGMFECSEISNLNLNRIDFSGLTNTSSMFLEAYIDELYISDWKIPNVTSMALMFDSRYIKNIYFSNFDTSNVTDMTGMFLNCEELTSLDLSGFNTSNVTNMDSMFTNCQNLKTLNVSSFDTSKVTSMDNMFSNCSSLINLDLSNFIINSNFDGGTLVISSSKLQTLDISNFDIDVFKNSDVIFQIQSDCLILVKNQAVKDFVLAWDGGNYTNVVIKNA